MITKRQKQTLDYISKYMKNKGYAPSLEEIKKHLGLSSVSTAHHHVNALEKLGLLKKGDNQPRAIDIVEREEMARIPLLGTITAGQPIEAVEIPEETITVAKNEVDDVNRYYALRVKGESMVDEGIFDGDIIIIKKQPNADDGQTVVAIIDENEATLKKIYKEKGRFRLQPANQTMLPFYRKEVEIRGVVVKIIRNLEYGLKDDTNALANNSLRYRKNIFLDRIKSANPNSRNKYKRVVETPIRYAGGKSLGVGFVVELLPDNIKRLISPFFGGGSIEIACNKYLGLEIIGYEIFDILVNYWDIQINKPKALFQKLSELRPDAKTYKQVKEILKEHWQGKRKLPPLELAAYYYFNHNLSYGPGFLGWPSKIYLNQERYNAALEKVRDFSVTNLEVKCASFEEAFEKYPDDFFYCDPPYLLGKGTNMFKGIYPMRNIPIHHNNFDHEKLRDLLKRHKGGFILSYNNCKTIRDWYSEYQQYFPEWQYTMGQGETRIGLNRKNGNANHVKKSHEILIYCSPKNKIL